MNGYCDVCKLMQPVKYDTGCKVPTWQPLCPNCNDEGCPYCDQGDPTYTGGSLMSDAEYEHLHRRGPLPPAGGEVEPFTWFTIPLEKGGSLWYAESKQRADRRKAREEKRRQKAADKATDAKLPRKKREKLQKYLREGGTHTERQRNLEKYIDQGYATIPQAATDPDGGVGTPWTW